MRGFHDLGGLPAGPVQREGHVLMLWEKRTHALLTLLSASPPELMNVHELRRGIESFGEAEYDRLTYYERWITSITNNLIQKGVISIEELGAKIAEIEEREAKEP